MSTNPDQTITEAATDECLAVLKKHDCAGVLLIARPGNITTEIATDATWNAFEPNDVGMAWDVSKFQTEGTKIQAERLTIQLTSCLARKFKELRAEFVKLQRKLERKFNSQS